VFHLLQQGAVVLRRQVGREEPHGREVNGTLRQQVENLREPPRRAGRLDPEVGGVLGEVEHLRAVGEQGGAALRGVEAPGVHLGEVGDELRGGQALAAGAAPEACEQICVGEK